MIMLGGGINNMRRDLIAVDQKESHSWEGCVILGQHLRILS